MSNWEYLIVLASVGIACADVGIKLGVSRFKLIGTGIFAAIVMAI